ncbi:hypothetical protein PFICI_00382 [Pestalotiopsis fici W106-1]|uniref:Heterokaryon incompatibility domain-containing protein n=1 Tax=Pestalotiopsis fici (strain W106-1 / CGMCC3.15140) TaxID=1229662 RepID=W3XKL1_PESFW|nr:uncharacterized protein PFICI_00382 [Pestalotiopsis fici W106-1]ETS86554.1 hypothetical protein PFICI_00382 [Pestalotiopsis fici W106-1]
MADTFQYGTLGAEVAEIRLLRVKPSDDSNADRAINYELETTILPRYGLQKTLEYYADSDVWGDELQKTPIRIDGRELMVPLNTAKALESFQSMLPHLHTGRDQSKIVRIGVDAVCINQSDRGERAEQVSRMKDIYEKALSVIIWLGDHASPNEAKAALQSVHNIYESSMHWYGGAVFSLANSRDIQGMLGAAHPPSDDRWHELYSSVALYFSLD